MTTRMIERQEKLGAVEDCMFEVLVESDSTVRAGIDAKLAEHARSQVVFVLGQYFLFLPVFGRDGFRCHLDGAVGASHLAESAGHTVMLVLFVMGHYKRAAETVEHIELIPDFRV